MRKIRNTLICLIALFTCVSLCACGKSEAATNVDNMILEIGEVTLDSGDKITAAEKAADELEESDYKQLEQISSLEEARTIYNQLVKDDSIAEIEAAINSIGTVKLESETAIFDVRIKYDRASKEVREEIKNYEVLEQAEKELSNLKVQNVINLIDQIGQVTLDSRETIQAASGSYNKLSSAEKDRVTNYANMESALKKLTELEMQDKVRNIIQVTKLQVSRPNSAGGVDVFFGFKNMSDKVIKYITFEAVPYNAVGDVVYCEIRNYANFRGQATGPYEKGEGLAGNYNWYWKNAWYNFTITDVELKSIDIEYMDGTKESLSGNDLNFVFN